MKKSDEVEQGGHYQQSELIEEILVGTRSDAFACWRLIDRPQGDLALFSTKEGLVAFHGRAAYERVIFEKFENAALVKIATLRRIC